MSECLESQCSHCGSTDVVTDFSAGDVVCRDCGMILGERIIDDTPEWRNFANDDRGGDPAAKSRVGEVADQRLNEVSLTTYLVDPRAGKTSVSATNGGTEGGGGRAHKRPNITSECAKVKRMKRSMDRVHEVADTMTLPKIIVETALDIYAEAEKKGISMRGPEKESMPVAVLFIACRKLGNARSLKEFEEASGVPKKRIGKSFMTLNRSLDIEMTQPTTEEYVRRFCSRLGLPFKTQSIANNVAKKADTLGLSTGKSPITVAASVIYLVAAYTDAKRSIQEISTVTMIGEKNMKVVCKELNKSRVMLFEGVLTT
uniref:General transcription factor TFIIB n=1 Tax=Globisporangium ultimum (strain ATCC 200006 / CBS 805.95 / DAOM BR144) TaxID=431595 RepID=K3WSJ6_GLOUD